MSIEQLPTGLIAMLGILIFSAIGIGLSHSRSRSKKPKAVEVSIAQVDRGISNEEIAAIMAAISATMTSLAPGMPFRIASITRESNAPWKHAGQLENVQSF